jgi:twitching motility protein PilJ
MTQPFSQKQAEQKFNQPKRLQESPLRQQQGRQESSFQAKAIDLSENGSKTLILFELKSNFWRCLIAWALGLSILPVLAVGTVTYYFDSQLTAKQISQYRQSDAANPAKTEALNRLLSLLLIETGVTTVLVGAIAAILDHRAISPVLNAAALSSTMVNRLRQQSIDTIETRAPSTSFKITLLMGSDRPSSKACSTKS